MTETVVVRLSARDKRQILQIAQWHSSQGSRRVTASDVIREAIRRYLKQVRDGLEPVLRARLDLPEKSR